MAEVSALPQITHEMLVNYYDNGVEDGIYSGKMKGYDEFKEAILFYLNMSVEDQRKVFGYSSMYLNVEAWNPVEFIDKINKYKEVYKLNLKVGDYVKDCSDRLCVVTNVDTAVHVMYANGKTHKWKKNSRFTKLGYSAPMMIATLEVLQSLEEKIL